MHAPPPYHTIGYKDLTTLGDARMPDLIIGHRNPDTDAAVATVILAHILKERGEDVRAGWHGDQLPPEVEAAFNRWNVPLPEKVERLPADGMLILVDHNELSQSLEGLTFDRVRMIIDHHKLNVQTAQPISMITFPWGSTTSILLHLADWWQISLPDALKGLALHAILDDTILLKSSLTTAVERELVERLSHELGVDWEALGREHFTVKARVEGVPREEVILRDYKEYDYPQGKVLISQVQVPDATIILQERDAWLESMRKLMDERGLYAVLFMVTDISRMGTELLIVSDHPEAIAEAFGGRLEHGGIWLDGVTSRKKEIVPVLDKHLREAEA